MIPLAFRPIAKAIVATLLLVHSPAQDHPPAQDIVAIPGGRPSEAIEAYIRASDFPADMLESLANAERLDQEDPNWRLREYRALVHRVGNLHTWPENLDFHEFGEKLISGVDRTHPYLRNAVLDHYYFIGKYFGPRTDSIEESRKKHHQFWASFFKYPDPLWVPMNQSLALFLYYQGDLQGAMDIFENVELTEDLELYAPDNADFAFNFASTYSYFLNNIGLTILAREQAITALRWAEEYKSEFKLSNVNKNIALAHLGNLAIALGNGRRAIEIAREALADGNPDLEPRDRLSHLAHLAFQQAHWLMSNPDAKQSKRVAARAEMEDSIAALEQALVDLADWSDTPDDREELRHEHGLNLSEIQSILGNHDEALRIFRAHGLPESLEKDAAGNPASTSLLAKGLGFWARLTIKAQCSTLERKKAWKLAVQAAHQSTKHLQGLQVFRNGYQPNRDADLNGLIEGIIAHYLDEKLSLGNEQEVLKLIFSQGCVGTISKRLGATVPALEEVQSKLCQNGAGILHFQRGADTHYWVLIDATGVLFHPIATEFPYRDAQRELKEQVRRAQLGGSSPRLQEARATLSAMLLPEDVTQWIKTRGWMHLRVSGLMGDYSIPFEYLLWEGTDPIGLTFPISHIPSVPAGVVMRNRQRDNQSELDPRILSMIATELEGLPDNLDYLEFGPHEEELVYGMLPSDCAHLPFRKTNAQAEELLAAMRLEIPCIHIVGHGGKLKDAYRTPGLVLGTPDGGTTVLTHLDVEPYKAPRLMILAACSVTESLPRVGDDGGNHLPGAMLAMGCDAVICSAHPVDYRESLALDSKLLEFLGAGSPPALALMKARRASGSEAGDLGRYLVQCYGLADRPIPLGNGAQTRKTKLERMPWLGSPALWASLLAGGLLLLWRFLKAKKARSVQN